MPSGILLLDKPRGLSSNAALQRVRAFYVRQKAGHVGSLDPLATGMLPICLGEATKIAGLILAGRKRYRFTVALGAGTATGDAEGAVTITAPVARGCCGAGGGGRGRRARAPAQKKNISRGCSRPSNAPDSRCTSSPARA